MTRRFDGRAAIVTGASSGIGRAVAQRLAAEGASLCLVAAPFDDAPLQELAAALRGDGADVVALAADVGEEATADCAVRETLDALGRLDALASNAGIAYWGDAVDAPVQEFDHTFRVNVRGMYLMVRAAARVMREQGGGRICCTASTASYLGEELQVSYNASKGAVMQLARSMALDLDDASYLCGALVAADGGMTAGFRTTDWDAVERPVAVRRRRAAEATP